MTSADSARRASPTLAAASATDAGRDRTASHTDAGRDRTASTDRVSDFEAAVRPHYANLLRRLVVVLRDERDAEDVAQDAYLKAFRAWDRFDGTDVRAWLYTIALRLAFNHIRGRRRWLAAVTRIEPRPWSDPSDPDLWAALDTLDARTRTALLLNVIDGYTHAEIGRMLAVPEGTVASWLSRGRATLRRELDPDHPSPDG